MWKDAFGREHRYEPPAGWVQPASETFQAAEEWEKQCAAGLRFEPYTGKASLSFVRGDCLEPLITSAHALRLRTVAPDEQLVDGGLYVIDWQDEAEIQAYRDKIGVPAAEKILITKFLRFICGEWHCQCKDSFASLGSSVVVAMVVGVTSAGGCAREETTVHARQATCGNPFDADSSECAQISANAATTSLIANNASGSGGPITGVSGLQASGFVIHPSGPPFDCTAVVTATIGVQQTAGTLGDVKVLVRFADNGSTYVSATQEVPINSTALQTYPLQWEFAHSRANAGLGAAQIFFDVGSTLDSFAWNTASLQIEYLIR